MNAKMNKRIKTKRGEKIEHPSLGTVQVELQDHLMLDFFFFSCKWIAA